MKLAGLSALELKRELFLDNIEERSKISVEFIQTEYHDSEKLDKALSFILHDYPQAIKPDFEQLTRVGFFPTNEAEEELDHAIKHALIGSYKAAFADIRRALELLVVMIYLTSEYTDRTSAINWISSKKNTPHFSFVLKELIKRSRYKDIDNSCGWSQRLREFYWQISDYGHNKGYSKSYQSLNNLHEFFNGSSVPNISLPTLSLFCDSFIRCIEEIAVLLSLYNPTILVPLRITDKFGINPPLAGFYEERQVNALNSFIPEIYKDFLSKLAKNDEEVISTTEWIHSLPDLTEEQIQEQLQRDKEFFKR